MRFKIPASLASKSRAEIRALIRAGRADILIFRDAYGRAVIVLVE